MASDGQDLLFDTFELLRSEVPKVLPDRGCVLLQQFFIFFDEYYLASAQVITGQCELERIIGAQFGDEERRLRLCAPVTVHLKRLMV